VSTPSLGGWGAQSGLPTHVFRRTRGLVNAVVVGGDAEWRLATARALHRGGPGGRLAFLAFDATRDGEALLPALKAWLSDPAEAPAEHLLHAGTLYLEHVTRLDPLVQAVLLSFAGRVTDGRNREGSPCRLIAGSAEDPWLAAEEGTFSAPLCDCLDKLRIEAPARPRRIVA
jgi:hypothetical protein